MCDSGVACCHSHNSVTSGDIALCSKRVAWASELAAVSQICVIHEAMDGCENLKVHL